MHIVRLYSTLLVLLLATGAMTACLVHHGVQKHRAALWLSLTMTGLVCYTIGTLGLQLMETDAMPGLTPGVALLLWSGSGAVLVVAALPRFLLSAFGIAPGRALALGLSGMMAVVTGLAAARCATGWFDLGGAPRAVETLLVAAASVSTILHARTSFGRPRFVQDGSIVPSFAESFGVSARELEVASLVLQGLDNAAIVLYFEPGGRQWQVRFLL